MSMAMQRAMIENMNYLRDPRVIATEQGDWFIRISETRMVATVAVPNDDGDDTQHEIGFKYATCGLCDGRGTHTNPSIDASGYDFDDDDIDEETGESRYMMGHYDVRCARCDGKRVTPEPAPRNEAEQVVLTMIEEQRKAERWSAAERRAERMMGA